MSLIDPKHLVAPFKNTVHIVTIVFLVILFAVFRLATGSVEIASGGFSNSNGVRPGLIPESAPKPLLPEMQSNEPKTDAQGLQDIEKALGINK
jgi:hypothetical protein